jgi:dTDP-4-amino-4,6-dideoxygalactose transaminase
VLHRTAEFASAGAFPVADALAARIICLPIYSDMTQAEAGQVVRAMRESLAEPKGRGRSCASS